MNNPPDYRRVKKYNSAKSIPATLNMLSHQVKILKLCKKSKTTIKHAMSAPCLKLTPRCDKTSSSPKNFLLSQVKNKINQLAEKRNVDEKKNILPAIPEESGSICSKTKTQTAKVRIAAVRIPQRYDFSVIFLFVLA